MAMTGWWVAWDRRGPLAWPVWPACLCPSLPNFKPCVIPLSFGTAPLSTGWWLAQLAFLCVSWFSMYFYKLMSNSVSMIVTILICLWVHLILAAWRRRPCCGLSVGGLCGNHGVACLIISHFLDSLAFGLLVIVRASQIYQSVTHVSQTAVCVSPLLLLPWPGLCLCRRLKHSSVCVRRSFFLSEANLLHSISLFSEYSPSMATWQHGIFHRHIFPSIF